MERLWSHDQYYAYVDLDAPQVNQCGHGEPGGATDRRLQSTRLLVLGRGADSFNFLTPYGTTQNDSEYVAYTATRLAGTLKRTPAWDGTWVGRDYGYLHPIVDSSAAGGTGRTFGLHPRMNYLKQMYDAGHATFVANVGALVEPIATNADFDNQQRIKPIGLYSHSDQSLHWQTAVPSREIKSKVGLERWRICLLIRSPRRPPAMSTRTYRSADITCCRRGIAFFPTRSLPMGRRS